MRTTNPQGCSAVHWRRAPSRMMSAGRWFADRCLPASLFDSPYRYFGTRRSHGQRLFLPTRLQPGAAVRRQAPGCVRTPASHPKKPPAFRGHAPVKGSTRTAAAAAAAARSLPPSCHSSHLLSRWPGVLWPQGHWLP